MPDAPEPPISATHESYGRLVKLAQANPIIAVCHRASLR